MCQDFCAQCPRCRGDQRSVPLTDSPTKYKCNYFFAFFFLFSGKYHVKMATFEERIHVQVVVAIDFGTTYSGYAISMDADYKIDPLKASYSFSLSVSVSHSVSHSVSVFLSRSLSLSLSLSLVGDIALASALLIVCTLSLEQMGGF